MIGTGTGFGHRDTSTDSFLRAMVSASVLTFKPASSKPGNLPVLLSEVRGTIIRWLAFYSGMDYNNLFFR